MTDKTLSTNIKLIEGIYGRIWAGRFIVVIQWEPFIVKYSISELCYYLIFPVMNYYV